MIFQNGINPKNMFFKHIFRVAKSQMAFCQFEWFYKHILWQQKARKITLYEHGAFSSHKNHKWFLPSVGECIIRKTIGSVKLRISRDVY